MFELANTTARSFPSISSHSSVSSRITAGDSGLAGGRLSQMIPTSPRVSSATVSRDWPVVGLRVGEEALAASSCRGAPGPPGGAA